MTPPGDAAIAVIALIGQSARRLAMSRFRPRAGSTNTLLLADFLGPDGQALDEVIVNLPDGQPDYLEIHCHGGAVVTGLVVSELAAMGYEEIPVRQMDMLRFQAGHRDALETEAVSVLKSTTSPLASALVRDSVKVLRAAAERRDIDALADMLAGAGPLERLCLTHRVAVAGAENSGKSTLVNALGGGSLVSEFPGTTRDAVIRRVDWLGAAVEITDTAGLGTANTPLPREARRRALQSIAAADALVWVVSPDTVEPAFPDNVPAVVVRVGNKCDIGTQNGGLPVCSLTGQGIDALRAEVFARLMGGVPGPGIFTARQRAAVENILHGTAEPDELVSGPLDVHHDADSGPCPQPAGGSAPHS
ncbi:MAG: 50S ribosome-binding GTPase [Planctomycetes bacterium]|nr:50S ribosome-binding GTPase [Planctomycetota bacterium]